MVCINREMFGVILCFCVIAIDTLPNGRVLFLSLCFSMQSVCVYCGVQHILFTVRVFSPDLLLFVCCLLQLLELYVCLKNK